MAVLPILTYPDPELKKISEAVTELNSEILLLIANLLETLEASPGCVGIAAPQVGALKRIIVVDAGRHPKNFPNHGRLILINPVIERQEGEVMAREGCLSLPHLTANVKRAREITFRARDYEGKQIRLDASGFEARVILHEADHLDGILFLDRVSSLKTDVFRRKNYAPETGKPEQEKGLSAPTVSVDQTVEAAGQDADN